MPVPPRSTRWRRSLMNVPPRGHSARRRGRGAKLYVDADGTTGGLRGAELLERNVAQEARGLTTQGRSLIRDYGEDGASLGKACAST